ncbi:uncharacterized protein LOC110975726 [Acanthaster planci]|uniref:Uncharacterized protein LOC110975726 n=1 Tax=Acanthaster planci TaxID=133434 RepID=A0A8B7XTG2_ACAPL|nr:uncharacterized protein LOC110975726 [Acanthaster planci]XP_022084139.1 uncharacterized protein LOC110975726 [Acanthaster planci]XP_022084140.1 uncharacterized protein LOC110975726 [Acanthaster planci]XP_022084141.1 uncharacterized protein LOC110975726 [Acanthaster planci]XP_022084142.1 uncharacterized protein LOC110975726 [Acanthaster planci]XP_022084143.1 uncharacterized protein LOC110975726 [Acanthaster planci]
MGDCLSNRLVVLGVALFAALNLIAGAMMASVGLVAFLRMPDLFTTGCIIWAGFVVFLCGALLLLMSICNKDVSLHKSYVMMVLSLTVLIVSVANIVLIEIVEWEVVRGRKTSQDTDEDLPDAGNDLTIFLTYLLGLLGSVIGLVASFLGTVYIYFTLSAPLLKAKRKSQPQYEVKMKRSFFDKCRKKPQRKFNFKLTPPPESQRPPAVKRGEEEADLYHVRWVYEDQGEGLRMATDRTVAGPGEQQAMDNRALMDEIREKVGARRLPSTSLDVTAQVTASTDAHPDGIIQDSSTVDEVVLRQIGQLPANARSSFRRCTFDNVSDSKVMSTHM